MPQSAVEVGIDRSQRLTQEPALRARRRPWLWFSEPAWNSLFPRVLGCLSLSLGIKLPQTHDSGRSSRYYM